MSKSILEKQADGTIKLTITIPRDEVNKARQKAVEALAKSAKIDGFRPGKAPTGMVEEKWDADKIREETLKELLPSAYSQAITENNLKPIINPKIHIDKIEEDKDWLITAKTCETPVINLGDYKKKIKELTAKSKIIIPGKEDPQKPSSQEIMKVLSTEVKAEIPLVLVEQEADRLLSQLLNDIKKLGLNLDQYLLSTNRKPESLREEYTSRARDDIKLEFALHKIAETENISVEQREIEEAILKAKNDEERANLEGNRYMLAAILRQQKTLDFLLNM